MFIGGFLLTSCENWLDLKPVDQATEEQIYSTAEGYRSVLNGLYKTMGSTSMYGRELSFGFLDCLSQQYDLTEGNMATELYRAAGNFQYDNTFVNDVVENIWKTSFNVIANANNLIQNIENESPEIFKEKEQEKNLILGEAYACRALVHFDLVRLFAPALINDDGASYVPYVEKYPNIQAYGIPVKEFLGKVTDDLVKAKSLVAMFDTTSFGKNVMSTGKGRFTNKYESDTELYNDMVVLDDFFKGRGYRLNYYSITALLARVYQYADRHDDALACTEEVFKSSYQGEYYTYNFFSTFDYWDITPKSWDAKSNLRLVENLIFAVYNGNAYNDLWLNLYFKKDIENSRPSYFVINKSKVDIWKSVIGDDESSSDIRSLYMIYPASGSYPVSGKWYCNEDEDKRDASVSILPVIRATEMYYIAAEAYARKGDVEKARQIIVEKVRQPRECYGSIPTLESFSDFEELLINDARREWISEGQLFYLYKRLNAEVDFGGNQKRELKRSEYLLPIPVNQSY